MSEESIITRLQGLETVNKDQNKRIADLSDTLDQAVSVLNKIDGAIRGDVDRGATGIVGKIAEIQDSLSKHEKRLSKLENERWFQRGAAAAIGVAATALWELVTGGKH